MARKLKPYKVDTISVHARGSYDMFLDREDHVFFGMVGPTRIEAKTAEECRGLLYQAAKEFKGLEWRRFIMVDGQGWHGHATYNGHEQHCSQVNVGFHRFEAAKTLDGSWVERPFMEDLHPDVQNERRQEHDTSRWIEGREHKDPIGKIKGLIEYSDEAWATLNQFKAALDAIAGRIEAMIAGPDLNNRLRAGVQKLLAPPAETKRRGKKK